MSQDRMDGELIKALRDADRTWQRVRDLLDVQEDDVPDGDLFARRMLSVLAEVERRGGRVARDELLAIGEFFGYRRRGMAGFYQDLLKADGDDARLTDEGRARLASLAARHEPLRPPPMTSPYWRGLFTDDPNTDPFIRHLRREKSGSGSRYSAADAERELYERPR